MAPARAPKMVMETDILIDYQLVYQVTHWACYKFTRQILSTNTAPLSRPVQNHCLGCKVGYAYITLYISNSNQGLSYNIHPNQIVLQPTVFIPGYNCWMIILNMNMLVFFYHIFLYYHINHIISCTCQAKVGARLSLLQMTSPDCYKISHAYFRKQPYINIIVLM